jgi:EmrB/QacA subfamily drug resistance transporter
MAERGGHVAPLLMASGGTFLAMLDSTVVNLAIPSLHHDFPAEPVSTLSWVITGYVVLFAALLAPAGRLADALGRHRMFVLGVTLFTAMSLANALAPTLAFLVTTRALQGVGAAAMLPAALSILLLDGPAERRKQALGLWSAASAAAAGLGPSIGGLLVDAYGWRSVFYINLPFGVAMIAAARSVRTGPPAPLDGRRLPDPVGTLLFAAGIGALTLGVTEGATWHWTSAGTLAALSGGAVASCLALLRSTRASVPAVETRLWGNRTFATANAVSLLYGMAQYPWLLAGVLYLTSVWHYSELRAGLAVSPGAIVASISAIALGRAAGRISPRAAALIGLVAIAACGVWLTFGLTAQPRFLALWLPAGVLVGFGMGATTLGTSTAAALSAPPVLFATASGMNTMARQLGGALGVAVAAVTLQSAGSVSVHGYERVYLYCTIFVVLGLALSAAGLRLPRPVAPGPAAETTRAPRTRTAPPVSSPNA